MDLHDPVDPFGIRRGAPGPGGMTAKQGMDPAITVGGQIGDQGAGIVTEFRVLRGAADGHVGYRGGI